MPVKGLPQLLIINYQLLAMSKTFLYILLIAILTGIAQLFLPWWVGILVAAAIGLLVDFKQKRAAFLIGFGGMASLWLACLLWIDIRSRFILSSKIAAIFSLPIGTAGSWILTALVAGISGGLGALTGNLLRRIFIKPKRGYFY